MLVATGIIVLRIIDPDHPRPFKTPLVPLVPFGAIVSCGYLICELPKVTKWRFVGWMAAGLVVYFCYGFRKSKRA